MHSSADYRLYGYCLGYNELRKLVNGAKAYAAFPVSQASQGFFIWLIVLYALMRSRHEGFCSRLAKQKCSIAVHPAVRLKRSLLPRFTRGKARPHFWLDLWGKLFSEIEIDRATDPDAMRWRFLWSRSTNRHVVIGYTSADLVGPHDLPRMQGFSPAK